VILPLVVIRRLDCVLEPTKNDVLERAKSLKGNVENVEPVLRCVAGQQFYNTSPLNFRRLLDDPNHIADNLRSYIGWFSDAARDGARSRSHGLTARASPRGSSRGSWFPPSGRSGPGACRPVLRVGRPSRAVPSRIPSTPDRTRRRRRAPRRRHRRPAAGAGRRRARHPEAGRALLMWHTTSPAAVQLGIARQGDRPSQQEVRRSTLLALLSGRHPVSGKPFRRAGGDGTRVAALDVTMSPAPKSVSVLWALGSAQLRHELELMVAQASDRAVMRMLREQPFVRRKAFGVGNNPIKVEDQG
jgi:TrwC relaxase/HsdM N-terminal domain